MKKAVKVTNEDEELLKQKEAKREEERKIREKKKEEYAAAARRRGKQSEAAEEAALKLGKKKSDWYLNPYYLTFGGLGFLLVYVIVMLFMNRQPPLNKIPVLDEAKIFAHNTGSNWKQGSSKFWEGATLADAKRLMSTSFASHSNLNRCFVDGSITIPDSFDSRTQWAECKSPIANQNKKCAGSYATQVASTFSERLCISSEDHKLTPLSAQELLSCDTANKGCRGGYINNALEYLNIHGIANEDCLPYKGTFDAKCSNMCQEPVKYRAETFCVLFGEDDIKREILTHGPVISSMDVYSDFLSYSSGVYTKGEDVPKFSGLHTIKIIGWGVESGSEDEPNQGNKYWLIENSWGEDWGDKGVAKISAGQESFFEQYAYSPLTKSQADEVKKKIEEQQKKKESEQPKPPEEPDMNLDDVDDTNKN